MVSIKFSVAWKLEIAAVVEAQVEELAAQVEELVAQGVGVLVAQELIVKG